MNFAVGRNSSFDFEFPREIKDDLSMAQSKAGGSGGGGSVYSGVSRLRTSQSTQSSAKAFNPHPQISFGGSDDVSIAFSTSRSMAATQADQSNGTCPSIQEMLSCPFLILITLL